MLYAPTMSMLYYILYQMELRESVELKAYRG